MGSRLRSASVPQRPVRTVAAVSRHPRRFPDPITAVGELIRVLGDVDPFLTIDREGRWIDACTDVAPDWAPSGWIERRVLAEGEWRVGKADGMRAEQLVERADGRPPWLVSIDELPIGENEAEPGGESFGLTTLIGRVAGLRRIGVNLDVVHPGQRSAEFHWHRSEEEGFLVLAGTGWLYAGDERYRVGPGDFFAKAEGPKLVHQFVNDGEADLRILSIGEHREDDAVEHPTPPWVPGGGETGGE
jgi:uncharacterized cupin superfamily protein